jgi:PAS domain S-box-containing protein
MNVRVLLVSRFRELSMKVSALSREALTIVHVAWLSDAIRRLKRNDFQAVMADLDLPDAKGLEALHALVRAVPHLPILVLGDDTVFQQMKMVEQGAQDYLLKHRLDADTLMLALHSSIARKSREGILLSNRKDVQPNTNDMGDGELSTDNAGLITFLNPVAERSIGWTCKEAIGRHVLEVFQVIEATTRERVMPRMESKAKKCRTAILPVNCLLVRRDGHESPIEEHAALIYDRSNHVSGMAVVFRDLIESRVRAYKPAQPAKHDVLNPLANRLPSGNWLALAPTQSRPVDSDECQSMLPLAQHLRPSRVRIPAPRPLN